MAVKKTISRWTDRFQDTFPKNIETARFSYVMIKPIPFINSWREEKVFKESVSGFKERNFAYVYSNITRASSKDQFEEIIKMFTVEEFVKS